MLCYEFSLGESVSIQIAPADVHCSTDGTHCSVSTTELLHYGQTCMYVWTLYTHVAMAMIVSLLSSCWKLEKLWLSLCE